jgi:hypothetical protein
MLALKFALDVLGRLAAIGAPLVGWVAAAHYWLGMSVEVALLGFIAVMTSVLAGIAQEQTRRKPEPMPARDFYVVTNEHYRWDITRGAMRSWKLKPELGGTMFAFDALAAAEVKYRRLEEEHSPLDLEYADLGFHDRYGYDEEETRLWVVYAHSKTEAHDKVFYDESRAALGHDGRTDDLLRVTDNGGRKQKYLDWWREKMEEKRATT